MVQDINIGINTLVFKCVGSIDVKWICDIKTIQDRGCYMSIIFDDNEYQLTDVHFTMLQLKEIFNEILSIMEEV